MSVRLAGCHASRVFGLFGLSVPELLVLAFFGWLAWPLVKPLAKRLVERVVRPKP